MLMHSKYSAGDKSGLNIVFVVLCLSLICQKDSANALIAFFYPSDKKYCFMYCGTSASYASLIK